MYWVERAEISRFKKMTPDGSITTIAKGRFQKVRWMYSTPQGVLYFFDLIDLYKIEPGGRITLVAKDMGEKNAAFTGVGKNHMLFGIWTDQAGDIYVANFGGQVVKRIGGNGTIKNVVHSQTPWAPTGGLFDKEGNLWLLEVSNTNEVRVRKVPATKVGAEEKNKVGQSGYVLPALAGLLAAGLLFFLVRLLVRKLRPQAA